MITLSCGQEPAATLSLSVMVTAPQLSVPVATPVAAELLSASHSMVTSGGQVMTGGVVSTTVMICTQLSLLPQSSSAVQVRVMMLTAGQLPGAVLSVKVTAGAGSQLSSRWPCRSPLGSCP